jgi:hypothetical protein
VRLEIGSGLQQLNEPSLRRLSGVRLMPVRTRGASVTGSGSTPPLPWGNRITETVFHLKPSISADTSPKPNSLFWAADAARD